MSRSRNLAGRVGLVGRLAGGSGRELDVSPAFGPVHVDGPLRRPDPVVLGRVGHLAVLAVDDLVPPFDPGEIDPPLVAVPGRRGPMSELREHLPGDRELDRPGLSLSLRLLSVPETWTAVFKPGISHSLIAGPPSRYAFLRNRSHSVLSALISIS